MKFLLTFLGILLSLGAINGAFGCTRDLSHLFWSPIIDRVSGDCSFVGYEINPSGVFFAGVMGFAIAVFVMWRKRLL